MLPCRCHGCHSPCTNACTVNAVYPDFNPRYWIYLIRMGMESELLRDCWKSAEHKEAVTAFLEKRPPRFR